MKKHLIDFPENSISIEGLTTIRLRLSRKVNESK